MILLYVQESLAYSEYSSQITQSKPKLQYNCCYSVLGQLKTGQSSSKEAASWLEKASQIPASNTVAPQGNARIFNDGFILCYALLEAIDYTNSSCELSQPKLTDQSVTVRVNLHTGSYSTPVCILIHSALSAAFVVSTDMPTINVEKLPKTIPVFSGYPEELVCDADGNPPPRIVWLRNANEEPCGFGSKLTVSEKGFYRCSATNDVGSVTHDVQVILKGKGTCSFNNTVQCRSCCHLDPCLNKKKKKSGEEIKCALHSTIYFFLVTNIICVRPKPASRPSFFFFFQTSTYYVDKQKAQRGETHRASGRNSSRFRRLYHRCAVWFVWALWCYDTWEKEKIWRLVEVLVSSLVSGQFIDRLQAHVIARKCWIIHNMGNVMFIPA